VYPSQYDIILNSTASNNFTGIQMANSGTKDSARFGAGGMPAALQLARDNGICYWEIWNDDLLNPDFDSLLTHTHCSSTTSVHDIAGSEEGFTSASPKSMLLYSNYPNPFNPSTTIRFYLPKTSIISLIVTDALGREITRLIDSEERDDGDHSVTLTIKDLPSGMYMYRLAGEGEVRTHGMLLLK
jgi:hypothetical protein